MATLKTTRTDASVDEFLAAVPGEARRADAHTIRALMARVTGDPGAMWGANIVGFGATPLRYASGRTVDWFRIGFSPRKAATTLYLGDTFPRKDELLAALGPHTTGASCVYVKRLDAVDPSVLEALITAAAAP
ncbi:DUF1801 domain-containing protein [Cryptosporangium arvum]|uniref:YdhG-like domain-containing protein n=1 Tax=Cryptosporangium arvum DSM 44712 TaxID=927661 RepID=A0A010Z327_9ACTN|nr:DUF1801 domain-containing protein [Cryptosporangium arvum]EXG81808.1 protein of unknown function DUF1801 [Cryptosporangium arvum DSM 44712]